jgi:hypothetical protein
LQLLPSETASFLFIIHYSLSSSPSGLDFDLHLQERISSEFEFTRLLRAESNPFSSLVRTHEMNVSRGIHEMQQNYCGPHSLKIKEENSDANNPIRAPARIHSVGGSVVNALERAGQSRQSREARHEARSISFAPQ